MRAHRDPLAIAKSILLHGCLIVALLYYTHHDSKPVVEPILDDKIEVQVDTPPAPAPETEKHAHTGSRKAQSTNPAKLDFLAPKFMREGTIFAKNEDADPNVESGGISGAQGVDDIVKTPFNVKSAFDHLALQINRNLDYAPSLVENNVQGTAQLNLHFDNDGNVDEVRSEFTGSHHLLRGLLVQATRQGLVEWYRSDAYRLKRSEFRGQQFRLVINMDTLASNESDVAKLGNDSYLLKREQMATMKACMVPGAINVMCVAKKIEGLFTGDEARSRFRALKEKLEHWDEIGLRGIGEEIKG